MRRESLTEVRTERRLPYGKHFTACKTPSCASLTTFLPGWYDINSFDDIKRTEDEAGIVKSKDYLHSLIATEIEKGIPSERIVLGGFSQGGAMSIFSGVTCPTRLGGIFGLSCYLLLQGKVKDMVPKENPNKVRWPEVLVIRHNQTNQFL